MSTQTFTVARAESGQTIAAVLRSRLHLSWSQARRLVEQGRVRLGGAPCPDPARRVTPGQRLEVRDTPARGRADTPAPRKRPRRPPRQAPAPPPPAGQAPVIRYTDDQVVVVDKPAGLTTMRHAHEAAEFGPRGRRFLPPTLADLLPALLAQGRPGRQPPVRAVHRLDKETSGLVVFARTPAAERHLGRQFRARTVERSYLAVVRGRAASG